VAILNVRKRSFASTTLRAADHIRFLGIVLPLLAVALLALGVGIAKDRRRAVMRMGVAIGVTGVVLAVALELTRIYVVSHTTGSLELSARGVHRAVGGLWDALLGDLETWVIGLTVAFWIVAITASGSIAPYSPAAGLKRVFAVRRRPLLPRGQIALGIAALVLAFVLVVDTTLVLRVVEVIGVALLAYIGMGLLVTGLGPVPHHVRAPRVHRRRVWAASGAVAAVAIGVTTAIALSWGAPNVRASGILTCNGYTQLCDRRLDQVAFAGTHNSMSAADSPGWYIANQERTIAQQLQDGIRAIKISTHYGIADAAGHVRTDIKREGKRLNRVSEKLSPSARTALQRLSGALGFGSGGGGQRDIYLCHTLCEAGSARMVDFLGTIKRFMDMNPGQVMIFFDEDYVAERDLQKVFQRAGLFSQLATLQPGKPLPTLRQLITSGRNIVVFAQEPTDPHYTWDMNGFQWIQDTPLGAVKPSQFTCNVFRGSRSNPLLMMNNWADVFPPRASPNIPLVKKQFIVERGNQCRTERGMLPNLILTDFYDRGDVPGAAAQLNGVANVKPAPTIPLTG
jgi:hypothetical protein